MALSMMRRLSTFTSYDGQTLLRVLAHARVDLFAVVRELAADAADDLVVLRIRLGAAVERVDRAVPELHVLLHQPVHRLLDGGVDVPLPTLEHLPLELLAEPRRVAEHHHVLDAHVAVEEVEAAPLQVHQQVVDAHHELLEVRDQIAARPLELIVDRLDARLVRGQHFAARLDHPELLFRQAEDRLQRRGELDADPLLFRQHVEDVVLQRLEAAARPLARRQRPSFVSSASFADTGKIVGSNPKMVACSSSGSRRPAATSSSRLRVDLVEHEDELLPPLADVLEELPLRLRQRPVDRRHEQDQVRARDEVLGDLLMPLHDGVRARRVDQRDVAQELDRIELLDDVVGESAAARPARRSAARRSRRRPGSAPRCAASRRTGR